MNAKLTSGLLASRMKDLQLSPEALALLAPVSNMTIRRLLRQPSKTPVPPKYCTHLVPILMSASLVSSSKTPTGDIYEVVDHLHLDGENVQDLKGLKSGLKAKLNEVGTDLKTLASHLWEYASARKTKQTILSRSIAIGAILYFINPFDLIPDSIPVFGYLDDFAVMTLALAQIRKLAAKSEAASDRPAKAPVKKTVRC